MTVLHSGTSNKYSENWSKVFAAKSAPAKATAAKKKKKQAPAKKSSKSK